MDLKTSFRISSFCIYNVFMVYLYISLPNYTFRELKSDIISSWCKYDENPCFQLIRNIIWKERENRNSSDLSLDEFPGAKDYKEASSWRVEYDETIHPVAIIRNYKESSKDNDIVTNIFR